MEFIPCIQCIPWFISTTNSIFAAAPTRNEQTQNFGVLSFINRSSSTIVFNQRHRWVAHRTPTPCENNYRTFHSLQSFNFCFADFHTQLPNLQSYQLLIFHPQNPVSSVQRISTFHSPPPHHLLPGNYKAYLKVMLLCDLHSPRPQTQYCYRARFLTFVLIFLASFSF